MRHTYSYINFHHDSPLECENLVLMCCDFRFRKGISDLLPHAGYREFDLICLPGASYAFGNEESRQVALRAIELLIGLHNVKRIILIDHEDCMAFGGTKAFPASEDEEKCHADSLRSAASVLRAKFPGLEIITLYAGWWNLKPVE